MHQLSQIAFWSLVFICGLTLAQEAHTTGGADDEDELPYVTMEVMSSGDNATDNAEADLNGARVNSSEGTAVTNVPEDDRFAGGDNADLAWLHDAIRDVTYYLRAYKFNEYDRRYASEPPSVRGQYFEKFPVPPLRSLHWEVRKHCEPSFLGCMKFLIKRVKETSLQRRDDTSVVIHEQNWTTSNHSEQIQTTEAECKKMRDLDDVLAFPFQGPLERFQWRTTASYYLCWYAMNGVPNLAHVGEQCDNFANCLDWKWGASNKDRRADDATPYACVMYSVCPDPCCPIRHLGNRTECWDSEVNPCFAGNPSGRRECSVERAANTDFTDIVLNRWNVTCRCAEPGHVWASQYGHCVDVNECATSEHTCDSEREVCVNLPGTYRCVCNWGYVWNDKLNRCATSMALAVIKKGHLVKTEPPQPSLAKSLVKFIVKKIFG